MASEERMALVDESLFLNSGVYSDDINVNGVNSVNSNDIHNQNDAHDEVVNDLEIDTQSTQVPKDKANIVLFSLFIIGLACFFPSTAILASNDYYFDTWGSKGEKLVFFAPILIQLFTPIIQSFVTKYQEKVTFTSRIEISFISNTIVAVLFPLQAQFLPDSLSYTIALFCILAIGAANSVLKATLLSLTSSYPPQYTQALLVGQAGSPLAVILLKIFLKKLTPESHSEEEKTANTQFFALVFFVISAVVTAFAAIFYKLARSTMFSRHFFPSFKVRYQKYLETKQRYSEHKAQLALEAQTLSEQPINPDPNQPIDNPIASKADVCEKNIVDLPIKIRKLDVLKKMTYWGVLLSLTCLPPNATYPALLNSTKSTFDSITNSWMHLIMLFVYCATDIAARAIPLDIMYKIAPLNRMKEFIAARYVLYAVLVACVYLRVVEISSWVIMFLVALTAATHAAAYVSILTQYKQVIGLSVAEANIAGSLSAIFIAIGVLMGCLLSLLVNVVIEAIFGKA
jgi:hypothetical protein